MERDSMTFDVLCVGAGIASLTTALRLLKRVKKDGGGQPPPGILIIDKGTDIGAHSLSGAVIDTEPFERLLDPAEFAALPIASKVQREEMCFLTQGSAFAIPWIPPAMRATGHPIISLSTVTKYIASLCEKAGAEVYAGFSGAELLEKDGRVVGVRVGDKGIDKAGQKRSNYEAGPDLLASAVVLGEGAFGLLTEKLIADRKLQGRSVQTYAVGVKEIVETPDRKGVAGTVLHTFGYPQDFSTYGGGFLYCMSDTLTAVGMVTALDYSNPTLNPHDQFRRYKQHPAILKYIKGGKVLEYGAKVLPEGGLHAVPGLAVDGAILVGDGAGLLDSLRLKGVHIAVESGIAAGDALFECWKAGEYSLAGLQRYGETLKQSEAWKQLQRVRNVRSSFGMGILPGMMGAGLSVLTNGSLPWDMTRHERDHQAMKPLSASHPMAPVPKPAAGEEALQLDRLSDVFFSKTHHEENQPSHLKILKPELCKECIRKYGAPCTLFCPAQVYTREEQSDGIRVDFSNCLHCKTCQIKDPLDNIRWTAPEGGGGPKYSNM